MDANSVQAENSVESILEKNSGLSNWEELLSEIMQYYCMRILPGAALVKLLYNAASAKIRCARYYRSNETLGKQKIELALNMLEMANYAYGEETSAPPLSYKKLSISDIPDSLRSAYDENTGFFRCEKFLGTTDNQTGFRVEAWLGKRESDNTMIVAFTGTHNVSQGILDFWQIFVASGCYLAGAGLLNMLMQRHPARKFYVTGHSLGGGLTQFAVAANMTSPNENRILGAYIFNPAGLSSSSLDCIGNERLEKAKNKIYAFETASDPVSVFFGVLGTTIDLPKTSENGHTITALRKCMRQYVSTHTQFTDGTPIPHTTSLNYKGNALYCGEKLQKNDYIASLNHRCIAIMEGNDNFSAFCGMDSDGSLIPLYMSNTSSPGGTGAYLAFHNDGVIQLEGGHLKQSWSLPTNGACTLRMGNDGNLVAYTNIYGSDNLFSSNSGDILSRTRKPPFAIPETERMDGMYEISCFDSSRVLMVENNSTEEGARIVISERDTPKPNQISKKKFSLISMNDGTYCIASTTANKVIGVKNNSCNDRDEIVQTEFDGSANQKWYLIRRSNGSIKFVHAASEKCLDVFENNRTLGTRLCLYRDNGAINQQFTVSKLTSGLSGCAVQFPGAPEAYLCVGKTLQWITAPSVFLEVYKDFDHVTSIPLQQKQFYTFGENIGELALIKGAETDAVYLLVNNTKKYWIPSVERFSECNFSWDRVQVLPEKTVAGYESGMILD